MAINSNRDSVLESLKLSSTFPAWDIDYHAVEESGLAEGDE
jgi:hypothetical protein